jgi:hypothetical protein
LFLAQAAFQKGPGIDAGGGVGLEEDEIAAVVAGVAGAAVAEEVVEGDFHQRSRRGVGGDVAAHTRPRISRLHHHRHRIPADDGLDALLDFQFTGIGRLLGDVDGVAVGGVQGGFVEGNPRAQDVILQGAQNLPHPIRAIFLVDIGDGFQPLLLVQGNLFRGHLFDGCGRCLRGHRCTSERVVCMMLYSTPSLSGAHEP